MNILAVYTIKGGVGKTSTAVNLAYLSAQQGLRTLVWDLDAQGAGTFYFRIKPKIKGGSKHLFSGKRDVDDVIKGTDFENLDLLPADFSFRNMDLELDTKKNPTQRLKKLLKPLADDYDLVILDCPPGITLLSEAILMTADFVLVPVIPTTLSVRTLEQLKDFIEGQKLKKVKLIPFFSMVDKRKKMHRELMLSCSTLYPDFLQASIPYASDIERMGIERMPLGSFAGNSASHQAYQALWLELQAVINANIVD